MPRFLTGQLAVAGAAAPVSPATTPLDLKQWVLRAPKSNVANVHIGPPGVTSGTGHIVEPGDTLVFDIERREGETKFDVQPTELYAVGTGGDKVSWIGSY